MQAGDGVLEVVDFQPLRGPYALHAFVDVVGHYPQRAGVGMGGAAGAHGTEGSIVEIGNINYKA